MKTMNKVFLIGHLGNSPELKTSENGQSYVRLSVATHRSQGKEMEPLTQWHNVYVWGHQAETCAKWLSAGALVFIEGEVRQVEAKQSKEDHQRLSLIHAHEVKFLNSKHVGLDNRPGTGNHNAVARRQNA